MIVRITTVALSSRMRGTRGHQLGRKVLGLNDCREHRRGIAVLGRKPDHHRRGSRICLNGPDTGHRGDGLFGRDGSNLVETGPADVNPHPPRRIGYDGQLDIGVGAGRSSAIVVMAPARYLRQ
ncbi:hypothetical protein LAUMK13_01035 [Mycobacterium innocens]|uniref:Uncharacterized protein n=1 Tax=Mycobacterium innocens TaxID=2341083 RepID=A0A498PTN7_9MYCO|nr:hypothetical protein LAUMK13_01035 [Mycobacterium innocens]